MNGLDKMARELEAEMREEAARSLRAKDYDTNLYI